MAKTLDARRAEAESDLTAARDAFDKAKAQCDRAQAAAQKALAALKEASATLNAKRDAKLKIDQEARAEQQKARAAQQKAREDARAKALPNSEIIDPAEIPIEDRRL